MMMSAHAFTNCELEAKSGAKILVVEFDFCMYYIHTSSSTSGFQSRVVNDVY